MYSKLDSIVHTDVSNDSIEFLYAKGFVFTRIRKGSLDKVISCRVNLKEFTLTSENRRILKNNADLTLKLVTLPYESYSWKIGKMGLDFYSQKFGKGIMSANKIKEMFIDPSKSNMNAVFEYAFPNTDRPVGYCLAFRTPKIIHYSYPFYDQDQGKNIGMAMMLKAIVYAKENNFEYIYLGSERKYKLQFKGVETFDGQKWNKHPEI